MHMPAVLVLLCSVSAVVSAPPTSEESSEAVFEISNNGTLHINSHADIRLGTNWDGSVFIQGVDVIKRLQALETQIDALIEAQSTTTMTTSTAASTSTTTTTTPSTTSPPSAASELPNELRLSAYNLTFDCSSPHSKDLYQVIDVTTVYSLKKCCCKEMEAITTVLDTLSVEKEDKKVELPTITIHGTLSVDDAEDLQIQGRVVVGSAVIFEESTVTWKDAGHLIVQHGDVTVKGAQPEDLDLSGITHLNGSLVFDRWSAMVTCDLSGLPSVHNLVLADSGTLSQVTLSSLTVATGTVTIADHTMLDDLDLPRLAAVGGALDLHNNENLEQLNLPALTHVDGALDLHSSGLEQLQLAMLTHVGGDLNIEDNALTADGVSAEYLSSVGRSLLAASNSLASFPFPLLHNVFGHVDLSDNDLTAFAPTNLQVVGGSIFLDNGNPALMSLDLSSLEHVGGLLWLDFLKVSLFDPAILVSPRPIGLGINCNSAQYETFTVELHPNFQHGLGLRGCESVETIVFPAALAGGGGGGGGVTQLQGHVLLRDMPHLSQVRFSPLTAINGTVEVSSTGTTLTLSFGQLTWISGDLRVRGEDMGLSFASITHVGGSVVVRDTTSSTVASLSLPSLVRVQGSFTASSSRLASIAFPPSMQHIGGSLVLSNNVLHSINFGGLTSIGGDVDLRENSFLTVSLGSSLQAISGALLLDDNPFLTTLLLPSQLHRIGGLSVEDTALADLDLNSVQAIHGGVAASSTATLKTVSFGSVTLIAGDVSLRDSSALQTVDFGSVVRVAGSIVADSNDGAAFVFNDLERVDGDLDLSRCGLEAIDFANLEHVGGVLNLKDNDLTTLELGNLRSVGVLNVKGNGGLQPFSCAGVSIACIAADIALAPDCPGPC